MQVRQSTARTIVIGPILDQDGVARENEVVASVKIHKNGGPASALHESATLTHSQSGFYRLALAADDLDTLGVAEFSLNSGENSMPVKSVNVLTPDAWDALHDAVAGKLRADVAGDEQLHATIQAAAEQAIVARSQTIRDTMKLAPSAGAAAEASIDAQLAELAADVASLDTAGNGPYPCMWTVEYDTVPIQNAVVAFYLGTALKARGVTDADGQVAMSQAAGQYTVAIEAAGFAHVTQFYTVSADAATWENTFDNLDPIGTVPTPTLPDTCTGYALTFDNAMQPEGSVSVCCRLVAEPDGAGSIGSDTVRAEVSDLAGLVVFTGLWIGAQYRFWRQGSDKQQTITIDAADVDEAGRYALPNFYG